MSEVKIHSTADVHNEYQYNYPYKPNSYYVSLSDYESLQSRCEKMRKALEALSNYEITDDDCAFDMRGIATESLKETEEGNG